MTAQMDERLVLTEAQDFVARYAPRSYYQSQYRQMEGDYMPWLCEALATLPAGRLLDIGPGWGTIPVWLRSRGWEVTVLDFVPLDSDDGFMTAELCSVADIRYEQINIEQGRLLEQFDVVLMTQVIPHLRWRPDRAIANVAKMVSDEGLFITSVLSAGDYPALTGEYGQNWNTVPEFERGKEQPSVEDVVVMCMYDEESFQRLLWTAFGWVQTWQPSRATTIFGQCKQPRR